jgi:hypothetical protein
MADIAYLAAHPKSGITFLNFLLFNALFDEPRDPARIDSDYIIDMHEHLARVPAPGPRRCYVKTHARYDAALPLRERADRAVHLVRDPIDVMMSLWDFMHLLGQPALLDASQAVKDQIFRDFARRWVSSGGDQIGPQTWVSSVTSWLDQRDLPVLFVRFEALKADPVGQLARVCEFLGQAVTPARLQEAARDSSVEAMRAQEQREIDAGTPGAFYRPEHQKGYAQGFRFVGRVNANAYDTMLTDAERREADRVFGPVLARVAALAG